MILTYILIGIILISSILNICLKNYKQFLLLNKYKNYQDIFSYFASESYDIIYKDQILGYVTDGASLVGDELETIKRNFIKLSFEIMGKNIEKILIEFYGTRETIITNLISYFQKRIDNDALAEYVKKKNDEIDESNSKTK